MFQRAHLYGFMYLLRCLEQVDEEGPQYIGAGKMQAEYHKRMQDGEPPLGGPVLGNKSTPPAKVTATSSLPTLLSESRSFDMTQRMIAASRRRDARSKL